MWSSRRRLVLALGAVGALAGCGFRPLYRDVAGRTDVVDRFQSIDIAPVHTIDEPQRDRAGQMLHTELVNLLHPHGRVANPVYALRVELQESISNLGVQRNSFATRANLRLQARLRLFDRRYEEPVLVSTVRVISSYNILDSEYGTLIAEQDAREKAIRSLSQEIRLRLGSFLNEERT